MYYLVRDTPDGNTNALLDIQTRIDDLYFSQHSPNSKWPFYSH